MTTTDVEQLVREAVVTILEADAPLITLMGGTARVVDRGTLGPDVAFPCLVYDVQDFNEATGQMTLLLTGLDTTQATAPSVARHLVKAAADALTQTAFAGQGMQVAPSDRRMVNVDEAGLIEIGNPNLRQADSLVPLLVA